MRVIIYLASHDLFATNNVDALEIHNIRKYGLENVESISLEVEDGTLQHIEGFSSEVFNGFTSESKASVAIELVAHGKSNSDLLISMKKPKPFASFSIERVRAPTRGNYDDIKPSDLADFFNEHAKDANGYKFKTLTLFTCRSEAFALELSGLLQDVDVIAYKDLIYIDPKTGLVYVGIENESIDTQNTPIPTLDTTEITHEIAKPILFRNRTRPTDQPVSFNQSQEKTVPSEIKTVERNSNSIPLTPSSGNPHATVDAAIRQLVNLDIQSSLFTSRNPASSFSTSQPKSPNDDSINSKGPSSNFPRKNSK